MVQEEEEVLAHMRLLSSEAKDWKFRVVTEAEEVLCHCRHSACQVPPAQCGNHFARESGEEECELFGDPRSPSIVIQHSMRCNRMNLTQATEAQEAMDQCCKARLASGRGRLARSMSIQRPSAVPRI